MTLPIHPRHLLCSALAAFAISSTANAQPSPLFDGSNAGVFVFDPSSPSGLRSFGLGDWVAQATRSGDNVTLTTEGGNSITIPMRSDLAPVLINQTQSSLPALDSDAIPISITGLSAALSAATGDQQPQLHIQPGGGSFTETIAVTLTGVAARGDTSALQFFWRINGGATQSRGLVPQQAGSISTQFYVVENGTHEVEYWLKQGSAELAKRSITLTLNNTDPLGMRRDTDGDGIPDLVEIYLGLDPISNDAFQDSDGDGWPDFEEALRCDEPNPRTCIDDPNHTPKDSDVDGWPDFDETLRGTNPHDVTHIAPDGSLQPSTYPDRPTARRLYEVEARVSGGIYQDSARNQRQQVAGIVTATSVGGGTVYDQRELPSDADLQAANLQTSALPTRFHHAPASTAVAAGNLPELRLPIGLPAVVRVQSDAIHPTAPWSAKGWLTQASDPTPHEVTAWLEAKGVIWQTAEEWIDGYKDYLRERLVVDVSLDLAPNSGYGIAAIEAALNWLSPAEGGVTVLGMPEQLPSLDTVQRLQALLDGNDRDIDTLHQHAQAATGNGGALAALASTAEGLYANPAEGLPIDVQLAQALQQLAPTSELGYRLRLWPSVDASTLANSHPLLDPNADADGDGLSNAAELSNGLQPTRPDAADSDGDGVSDADDRCPHDASNRCISADALNDATVDSDGDGIPDVLDNCPQVANPTQRLNSTLASNDPLAHVGQACLDVFPAMIVRPLRNLTLPVGSRLDLQGAAAPDAVQRGMRRLLWRLDGLAPDTNATQPPPLVFTQTGTYTIALDTFNAADKKLSSDTRTITVVDSGVTLPTLSIADAELRRPAAGTRMAAVPITLSAASTQALNIRYRLQAINAQAGIDYEAADGELQLLPGQTSTAVPVNIIGSTTETSDRIVKVELSAVAGAVMTQNTAMLYIRPIQAGASNDSPLARDDHATTFHSHPITVDVLANDEDPDGDPLTVSIHQSPSSGSAIVTGSGQIRYTPASSSEGLISIGYTVDDGAGGMDTATLTILVLPEDLNAYVVYLEDDVLYRVALNATNPTPQRLSASGQLSYWFAVSPDGAKVAYTDDNNQLHLIQLTELGGSATRILPVTQANGVRDTPRPQFTADSAALVYGLSDSSGAAPLVITDLTPINTGDSSNPEWTFSTTQLLAGSEGQVHEFVLDSSRNQVLAFTRFFGHPDNAQRIVAVPFSSGTVHTLATLSDHGGDDGIALQLNASATHVVYMFKSGSSGDTVPEDGVFAVDLRNSTPTAVRVATGVSTPLSKSIFTRQVKVSDDDVVYFIADYGEGGADEFEERPMLYRTPLADPSAQQRVSALYPSGNFSQVSSFALNQSMAMYVLKDCSASCSDTLYQVDTSTSSPTPSIVGAGQFASINHLQAIPGQATFAAVISENSRHNQGIVIDANGVRSLRIGLNDGADQDGAVFTLYPLADGQSFVYAGDELDLSSTGSGSPIMGVYLQAQGQSAVRLSAPNGSVGKLLGVFERLTP